MVPLAKHSISYILMRPFLDDVPEDDPYRTLPLYSVPYGVLGFVGQEKGCSIKSMPSGMESYCVD